jgi:23S rRNA (uridine2552-2'-O)-methyltransferase
MAQRRTSKSKQWMREHVNDAFVQRAQREGYRSRAAYKLQEIADRDGLLKPGHIVVDLGAAPGGWSQLAAQRVGAQGRVIAIDLLPMTPVRGVEVVLGDFRDEAVYRALAERLAGAKADLVLSDMAPNLTGIASTDQVRGSALAELALEFAVEHLKPGGALLVKTFHGAGFEAFLRALRGAFGQVMTRKPDASRSRSSETYLLGKGLKSGGG